VGRLLNTRQAAMAFFPFKPQPRRYASARVAEVLTDAFRDPFGGPLRQASLVLTIPKGNHERPLVAVPYRKSGSRLGRPAGGLETKK